MTAITSTSSISNQLGKIFNNQPEPIKDVLEYLDTPKELIGLEKVRQDAFQAVKTKTITAGQAKQISSFIDKSIVDLAHNKLKVPCYYHGSPWCHWFKIIDSNKIKTSGGGAWFATDAESNQETRYGPVNYGVDNSVNSFHSKDRRAYTCYAGGAFGFKADIAPLSQYLCVIGTTKKCRSKVKYHLKQAKLDVPVISLKALECMSRSFNAHASDFGEKMFRPAEKDRDKNWCN